MKSNKNCEHKVSGDFGECELCGASVIRAKVIFEPYYYVSEANSSENYNNKWMIEEREKPMSIECVKEGNLRAKYEGRCWNCNAVYTAQEKDLEHLIVKIIDCPYCGQEQGLPFNESPQGMLYG